MDHSTPEALREELEFAIKQACDDAEPDVRTGLSAALNVCREHEQTLLAQIRAANERYGVQHPTLPRDLPPELQDLNDHYRYVQRRIRDLAEMLERVVVRPDGKTIILPRGHTFAGFSEDGKVISGHMTAVVHHEDRRRSARTVVRSAQRRTRGHRPAATRRTASSSTTSSSDPGDPDGEPSGRRRNPRHVSHALAALLERIGGAS